MNTSGLFEKLQKPLLIMGGLVATYALVGFVVLPKVLESKLPELIETETGRKAAIKKITFNPFLLELSLQDFSMQEKDLQTFVSFDEFFINIQVLDSLSKQALVIEEVSLVGPYVRIETLPEGQYNFSDLLSAPKEEVPKEKGDIFPLVVHQIRLIKGQVKSVDSLHTKPITTVLKDLNLELENLSTLLDDGSILSLSMALESGGALNWQGDLGINPLFSKGHVTLEGLNYASVWEAFLQERVQFQWVSGQQLIDFKYDFSYADEVVHFNLTEGRLLTENLSFVEKGKTQDIITMPYFLVEGITVDLDNQRVNIDKIESKNAEFNTWLNRSGELNYQTIFASKDNTEKTEKKQDKAEQTSKPWDVNIHQIALNESNVNFKDKRPKEPVAIQLAAFNIGLKNYHVLAGQSLQMTANQGKIKIQDFTLQTQQAPKLMHIPSLRVAGLEFDLLKKRLNIASFDTADAKIKAWLAKDGVINYQRLFEPERPQKIGMPDKAVKDETLWSLALQTFNIDNYALEFTDHTPKKPVSLNLSALNFSLRDFNNQQGTALPISLSALLNQRGQIKVSGQTILEPFSSDLDLVINRIGLRYFQPYVNQSAKLDILSGDFNTKGKLVLSKAEQGDLALSYQGGLSVNRLHTRDQILKKDFLNWKTLKLNNVNFNLQPPKLNIKSIHLDKLYSKFTIKEDKTTNMSDVIVTSKVIASSKKQKKESGESKKTPFTYRVDKIKITDAESDFSDYSLILPFVVKLNDLEGAIDHISSNQKTKTTLKLVGKTFDLAPVDIHGYFNANLDELDIAMDYKNLPLPLMSPYMVEFAGHRIEKGKLSLDLLYQVTDGQLTAKNNVLIDQLELGDKVESPKAIDLPLGLAIALLKDKNGKISIDMPLKGSMDDPDFSVGPLLLDTFVNLIIKAVASPFAALGTILGDDGDFSMITFKAGNSELGEEQDNKLQELAKALSEKPGLSLEIKGQSYTNQDWPAMKEQALLDQLKQIRAEEFKKEGEIKLPEDIELSKDEYQRLLADLFIQKFPELAERSLFGTPKLVHPDMGGFYTVASNMLQGMIKPDPHKLSNLSMNRARNIAKNIVNKGKIEQSRIFILNGIVTSDVGDHGVETNLSLKVQ